jgi:hypothetical protein
LHNIGHTGIGGEVNPFRISGGTGLISYADERHIHFDQRPHLLRPPRWSRSYLGTLARNG